MIKEIRIDYRAQLVLNIEKIRMLNRGRGLLVEKQYIKVDPHGVKEVDPNDKRHLAKWPVAVFYDTLLTAF